MNITAKVSGVKIDTAFANRANKARDAASKLVFAELNSAFQAAIGSKVWEWPRVTIRSGGTEAGSPRNIVDRGTLRASNSFTINGGKATFSWYVGYATAVHYGASIYPWGNKNAEKVTLPARPWTSAVLGTVRIGGIEPYNYREIFRTTFLKSYYDNNA